MLNFCFWGRRKFEYVSKTNRPTPRIKILQYQYKISNFKCELKYTKNIMFETSHEFWLASLAFPYFGKKMKSFVRFDFSARKRKLYRFWNTEREKQEERGRKRKREDYWIKKANLHTKLSHIIIIIIYMIIKNIITYSIINISWASNIIFAYVLCSYLSILLEYWWHK